MASQLRLGSQRSSGAFGGFPTPSQYIEPSQSIDYPTIPSQPHHEVVSSQELPDLDIPSFSFTPGQSSPNMSQEDMERLSQREERLAKVVI